MPTWSTSGLRVPAWTWKPAIKVGAGFGRLPAAEQDGALAIVIVLGNLFRTGAVKAAVIYVLCFIAIGYPLVFLAAYSGTSSAVVLPVLLACYVFGYLLMSALRLRRIIYRVDHRVAEVMGRPVVDSMMDHEIRNAHLIPGFLRLYFALYSPTLAQRVRRLDAAFGPRRIAA
ncbi:hypothetical protein ACFWPH_16025 [Nocardia sp. NPDC058499]|uniref:hypothetical protein n=1 Tax=Nocardia sp. NPDC058499 TaxID=3346530 RepID=UPI003669F7EB